MKIIKKYHQHGRGKLDIFVFVAFLLYLRHQI